MICVKGIKIILPYASSLLCEYGFSALTEIKSKKQEVSWNWRHNADVLGNDGSSFQSFSCPKADTPNASIFLKQLCFVVSLPRIFLNFRSASQAEKVWESLVLTVIWCRIPTFHDDDVETGWIRKKLMSSIEMIDFLPYFWNFTSSPKQQSQTTQNYIALNIEPSQPLKRPRPPRCQSRATIIANLPGNPLKPPTVTCYGSHALLCRPIKVASLTVNGKTADAQRETTGVSGAPVGFAAVATSRLFMQRKPTQETHT